MTAATWKIIEPGRVPEKGVTVVPFACHGCGHEAELPVLGMPLAQFSGGIVFDVGDHAMPRVIECRHCRRRFELD